MTIDSATPIIPARSAVPGPPGYPLLGIIPKIGKDPLKFFVQAAIDYGPLVRLDMGPRRMYLLGSPAAARHVMIDNNQNFIKGYEMAQGLLGDGLVASNGDFWKRQRRLMQPAFHKDRIAALSGMMVEETDMLLKGWASYSAMKRPIDVAGEMMSLTQNIIVRTMFSTGLDGAKKDAANRAFNVALEHLNQRMFAPVHIPESIPTPGHRRYKQALRTLNETVYSIIAERRARGESKGDLLSMLLDVRDENGEGMTDQQLRDEVLTIFFAGHETTASTLSWVFYLLSQHRDWDQRVRLELARVLKGRLPTSDDLPNLRDTRLVIDEALRLYPPAWMVGRRTVEDDTIEGYPIPAGSMLMLSPYVLHHHTAYWGEPEKFDPERFLPERSQDRAKYAYIPFIAGPRQCIGNTFALVEATLIMATLMQHYEMTLVPGYKVEARPISTLRPKPGVLMQVRKIHGN